MSFLDSAHREIKIARRYLLKKWDQRFLVANDIKRQVAQLGGYVDDIAETEVFSEDRTGPFCLFVYYEPDGALSGSVSRIFKGLKARGVHTVLLCNHVLSDLQKAFFAETCHAVVRRGNQGFDFGAYKDGVRFLRKNGYQPSRLLILNDSVFYREEGLDAFIAGLCGEEDAVAAFENWGEGYHLQSFALGISGEVFDSPSFKAFWEDYVPVNNRIHAILGGEKKLSDAVLAAARSTRVLYPASALYEALKRDGNYRDVELIHLPRQWRDDIEAALAPGAERSQETAREVTALINRTSPIHSGAYLFPRYLGCPILKKDLVYRERFWFWELQHWAAAILDEAERTELLTAIRRRGEPGRLSAADRRRYNVGII